MFFNLKGHCFVFVFFVASVVATPQSLSSSFFLFFLINLCCMSGIKFQACCHVFCFCFMFFRETRAM
jgi:hypothetical protein